MLPEEQRMKRYNCPKCDYWMDGADLSLAAYCLYCQIPMVAGQMVESEEESKKGKQLSP